MFSVNYHCLGGGAKHLKFMSAFSSHALLEMVLYIITRPKSSTWSWLVII